MNPLRRSGFSKSYNKITDLIYEDFGSIILRKKSAALTRSDLVEIDWSRTKCALVCALSYRNVHPT